MPDRTTGRESSRGLFTAVSLVLAAFIAVGCAGGGDAKTRRQAGAGPGASTPSKTDARGGGGGAQDAHPLDPLSAAEIQAAVETIRRERRQLPESALFAAVVLNEPSKEAVLRYRPGGGAAAPRREAFAVVYDRVANRTYEAEVDLVAKQVKRFDAVEGAQVMILPQEFEVLPAVVQADPRVRKALEARGITDPGKVQVDVWAPGHLPADGQPEGARLSRCLFYYIGDGTLGYGRPVEGLVAVLNLNTRRVVQVIDSGPVAMAKEPHDFFDPAQRGTPRQGPRPLRLVQPQGPSFEIRGHEVRWQKWRFRFANHQREGLVVYQVGYEDGGRVRPVLYRGSLSEMVVPYGDPDERWVWRAAFDQGEYGLGQLSNSLQRGLDVPDNAALLDTVFADDVGGHYTIPASVAVYERDGGILWKHTDDYATQKAEGRRARELVIGHVVTVGNYDYGLSWVFTQDGQIKVEAELTGILLAKGVDTATCQRCKALSAAAAAAAAAGAPPAEAPEPAGPGGEDRYGTLVAAHVVAPNHQHFFNFRLDLDVDGTANSVSEMNVRAAPRDPDRPGEVSQNAFLMEETVLPTERAARRDLNPQTHRRWRVFNPAATNALGHPASYVLEPGENSVPYLAAEAPVRQKAQFVDHHLWATRYDPRELYAAGPYPNQSRGGAGLPRYAADGAGLVNQDVVLWYTFGLTHVPRPEEWPVMPAARVSFRLVPKGFFTRNPALDVPPATPAE